ncbi:golvesin [Heterostelium album PN500]|uniref:Golvesin n=1 Tax=Heterostelium pallidum (strain ATCC 26659 / Pp 5 / PN500) TaxID=670386 RepID=D3BP89_HETP5|nr:golvesin [Heterostelium album PN500]EFA77099.1 golvesin [Heterostelium album PN500]|eukprot:XP_020429228.1 golvesin [Heterostelium album PN500]
MFNNNNDENNNNNNSLNNEIGSIFNRNINNVGGTGNNININKDEFASLLEASPMTSPTSSPHNSSSRFLKVVKSKRKFSIKQQVLPLVAMICLASIVVSLVIISRNYSANNMPGNQTPFVVINDPELQQVAEASRAHLLNIHQGVITKLDFAILVLNPVGSWSLAAFHGDTLSNASRCVYLPFLAAAVKYVCEK